MKIKNLTERDQNILHALYRFRTFTTPQIYRLFFSNNKTRDYCWQRMSYLKRDGYIMAKPVVKNGKRDTHSYFLTAKGMETLKSKGIVDKTAFAKDLQLSGYRMIYANLVNEIYVQLKAYGFDMWDSRQVKNIYELDRNSLIQGCLVAPDQRQYGVYLLTADPEEKTIAKVISEIKKNFTIKYYMVLCSTPDAFTNFERVLKYEETRIRSSVSLLPYDDALIVLKTIGTEEQRVALYQKYGAVRHNEKGAFPYTVVHNGEVKYVCENLHNSTGVRRRLSLYTSHEFKREGRKVLLLIRKGFMQELQDEFKHYPHFEYKIVLKSDLIDQIESREYPQS
ncbi:replication-relaxation family protein [Paenibacillus amylolyticus]|uniref:replication-relaxation family protein n=1 Tax=Paenibacillus amylolyticus TaxID=1451 RepID=UPI00339A8B65